MSFNEKFSVTAQRIHWDTDITLFEDLLSADECTHLIRLCDGHFKRSGTFSSANDPRRTSSSFFLTDFSDDPVVKSVVYRCSILCGYPASHVETLQVVRYLPGEKFVTHTDNYAKDSASYQHAGQRNYTFFVYLNDMDTDTTESTGTLWDIVPIKSGGETFFPDQNFKVSPKRGAAAFWRNIKIPDGSDEESSLIGHSGEPTVNWTKYGMNVWIRHRPFRHFDAGIDPAKRIEVVSALKGDFADVDELAKEFVYIKNTDSAGHDLFHRPGLPLKEMFKLAIANKDVVAFNSNGWYKSYIWETNPTTWPSQNNCGIYVKAVHFNKLKSGY